MIDDALYQQPIPEGEIDLIGVVFTPIMNLPASIPVFDFSSSYDPDRLLDVPFGIGKYDEIRPTMYTEPSFLETARNIHMGIDIAGPEGTPVYSFFGGEIFAFGDNDRPQDYGPTIVTRHFVKEQTIYALYGHLSRSSIKNISIGQTFDAGAELGSIGGKHENGGWNPHLHFQLSRIVPAGPDLPGAVNAQDRPWARRVFPDPRLVLGPLY